MHVIEMKSLPKANFRSAVRFMNNHDNTEVLMVLYLSYKNQQHDPVVHNRFTLVVKMLRCLRYIAHPV